MVMLPGFPPGLFSDHRCLGVIDCDRIPRSLAIITLGSISIPSMIGPFVAKHPGPSYDHLPEFFGASGKPSSPHLLLFDLSPDDPGGGLSASSDPVVACPADPFSVVVPSIWFKDTAVQVPCQMISWYIVAGQRGCRKNHEVFSGTERPR